MPVPRKVFRIEQTPAARVVRRSGTDSASLHRGEILQVFDALQARIAAAGLPPSEPAAHRKAAAVHAEVMARIAQELDAVAADSAQATQKILAAAEEIDQLADNLSASLKGRIEQDLAQDISDIVIRIFEACNFQDLVGQRVAKVMKTLSGSEVTAPDDAPDLHGPRLEPDVGHMTQGEIDALFGV